MGVLHCRLSVFSAKEEGELEYVRACGRSTLDHLGGWRGLTGASWLRTIPLRPKNTIVQSLSRICRSLSDIDLNLWGL